MDPLSIADRLTDDATPSPFRRRIAAYARLENGPAAALAAGYVAAPMRHGEAVRRCQRVDHAVVPEIVTRTYCDGTAPRR